jgi:ATP-dependent protease Clp ATPase subunit
MVIAFTQNAKTELTHCSFCRTADNENRILITGMNGAICETCIADAKNTLMTDAGVLDPVSSQQFNLRKSINKRLIIILIILVIAIAQVITKKIFS